MNGIGVDCDKQEGFKWIKLAAQQGDAISQHNLGMCYEHGQGVAVDKKEADKWYALAIRLGFVGEK
jgi:TPR repeat protein